MQLGPTLVNLSELHPHEATNPTRVKKSTHMHVRWGVMRSRVIVDGKDFIVIDGHHRLAVAHRLGLRCVPVLLVDPAELRVERRGSQAPLTHAEVVAHVRQRGVMPARSTKYALDGLDVVCDVPLDRLRHPAGGSQ
ncbi:MAG: hypothetical protein CMB11_01370 [Euryarchaeota archaeon]|nr:hypothetical protein [Euryarchaeota archaeon]